MLYKGGVKLIYICGTCGWSTDKKQTFCPRCNQPRYFKTREVKAVVTK